MKNFRAFKEYNLNPVNLLCIYDPVAIEEELKSEAIKVAQSSIAL